MLNKYPLSQFKTPTPSATGLPLNTFLFFSRLGCLSCFLLPSNISLLIDLVFLFVHGWRLIWLSVFHLQSEVEIPQISLYFFCLCQSMVKVKYLHMNLEGRATSRTSTELLLWLEQSYFQNKGPKILLDLVNEKHVRKDSKCPLFRIALLYLGPAQAEWISSGSRCLLSQNSSSFFPRVFIKTKDFSNNLYYLRTFYTMYIHWVSLGQS